MVFEKFMLCGTLAWNWFIWHSPHESRIHCDPKDVCLSNFREVCLNNLGIWFEQCFKFLYYLIKIIFPQENILDPSKLGEEVPPNWNGSSQKWIIKVHDVKQILFVWFRKQTNKQTCATIFVIWTNYMAYIWVLLTI